MCNLAFVFLGIIINITIFLHRSFVFVFIFASANGPPIAHHEENEHAWIPYSSHVLMIGLHDSNAILFTPLPYDQLLQKEPKAVVKEVVDINVGFLENTTDVVVAEFGPDFRRWLSRAK